jgi:RimJ/RimL family protein N-acetyltransferase
VIDVPTLRTDRFIMRPIRPSDTQALYPTLSDPEQCLYLTRPAFTSHEELHGWLADPSWPGLTWIAEYADGPNAGAVAGRFVASPTHAPDVTEIGYIVCADRQGEGIASECSRALTAHLLNTTFRKLTAEVDTRNEASVRLLERLGFTREAHFREHEITHIGMCDVYFYGLRKSDWAARSKGA